MFSQIRLQQEQAESEPNAFDLTWRNYLPSTSQLCSCFPLSRHHPLTLDDQNDNLLISPPYYNDFYQSNAVRGYLTDPLDREFDDMLSSSTNKNQRHCKKKKRSKRRKYPKQRLIPTQQDPEENDYDEEDDDDNDDAYYPYYSHNDNDDDPVVYKVHSDEDDQRDAVFLGDDQIAKMVNNYDQAAETSGQQRNNNEFYAPRTIPFMINEPLQYSSQHDDDHNETTKDTPVIDHYQSSDATSATVTGTNTTTTTTAAALAAQAILSETLEDLTEKLAFIRTNMMDIGTSSTAKQNEAESDYMIKDNCNNHDEDDTATLHTLKTIVGKTSPQRSSLSDDLDSIASEALHEYENTTQRYQKERHEENTTTSDYHNRRFSSNVTADFVMPLDSSSSPSSYAKSKHPFSYFTEHIDSDDNNDESTKLSSLSQDANFSTTSGIQGAVINFGKKWFG